MNIEKNNKLIAEFMNLPSQDASNGGGFLVYEDPFRGEYVESIMLSYDDSWNYLMPVVEKIESQGLDVIINTTTCVINDVGEDRFIPFQGHSTSNKIDAVYYTIVEYIKWYNKNKKE